MATQPTISASRVAAMLGQSKFQTRLGLYYELTGEAPPKLDNELLEEGREFEQAIARIACRKFGLTEVIGFDSLGAVPNIVDGDLSGHPDRIVIDHDGRLAVLEIKNTLFADIENEDQGWGTPGTDQVPAAYWMQCQVYAALLPHADFSCTAGVGASGEFAYCCYLAARLRSGVHLYRIPIDREFIAKARAEASSLLDRVARREPPDPQESSEFRSRWLPEPKKAVECTAEIAAVAAKYAEMGKQIRMLEGERENLAALILGFAQDASVLMRDGKTIGTVGADREFDRERFMAENPAIAAMFVKLDVTAVKKAHAKLADAYMKAPDSAVSAKRVIRISAAKEPS